MFPVQVNETDDSVYSRGGYVGYEQDGFIQDMGDYKQRVVTKTEFRKTENRGDHFDVKEVFSKVIYKVKKSILVKAKTAFYNGTLQELFEDMIPGLLPVFHFRALVDTYLVVIGEMIQPDVPELTNFEHFHYKDKKATLVALYELSKKNKN